MSPATIFLFLCFVGFIVGMIAIAWWSDRVHARQLAEHNERMREIYKEHR